MVYEWAGSILYDIKKCWFPDLYFWDTLIEKWHQQKKEKINFWISGGAVRQQGNPVNRLADSLYY